MTFGCDVICALASYKITSETKPYIHLLEVITANLGLINLAKRASTYATTN